MTGNDSELFERDLQLPDDRLTRIASRLVGFDERYSRIERDLRLMLDPEGLRSWSQHHYKRALPLLEVMADRYPLIAFKGDVGNGKTVTAEAVANRLTLDLRKDGWLFTLSTRVRGAGRVGQMSDLIVRAFSQVVERAGKDKLSFLVIDEADSLAAGRESEESHHEDKVAVNTLIQRIDDVRRLGGRLLIILCTNRYSALDAAIVRRIAREEVFDRPNDDERCALLRMDLEGARVKDETIKELVRLTGPRPDQPGFTYSDLRTRLLPDALGRAFPKRRLEDADLLAAAKTIGPSPVVRAKAQP